MDNTHQTHNADNLPGTKEGVHGNNAATGSNVGAGTAGTGAAMGTGGAGTNSGLRRRPANPSPLGYFAFASSLLVYGLVQVNARHVFVTNIIVGIALAYGGLAQLLAGMWEFAHGNTFNATAFTSYGGYWLSLGILYWPDSGFGQAYLLSGQQGRNALGFYFMAWFIFSFLMLIASIRTSGAVISFYVFLCMAYLLFMIGEFVGRTSVVKGGGGLDIVAAFIGYYIAASGVIHRDSSYFALPVADLSQRNNV